MMITTEDGDYLFRSIRVEDLEQVKAIHTELFPVKYKAEFFDGLLHKKHYVTVLCIFKPASKVCFEFL